MIPQEEELRRHRLAQERASGQKRTYGNPRSEMPIDNKGLGKPQNLEHLKNSNYTLGDSYGNAERLKNAREHDHNKDSNETDTSKKHGAFEEATKSLKKVTGRSKILAPLEALSLARKLRKDVENHEASPWIIAFVIALSCDFVFDMIPIAGWMITLFFKPFLFIFLWGKGTWRIKLIYYIVLFLDFFPIIKLLPLSTACIVYAFSRSKEKAQFASKLLEELKAEANQHFKNIRNAFPHETKN